MNGDEGLLRASISSFRKPSQFLCYIVMKDNKASPWGLRGSTSLQRSP
jgi:hypothetical protein